MKGQSGLAGFGALLSLVVASLHMDMGIKFITGVLQVAPPDPNIQLAYGNFFFFTGFLAAIAAVAFVTQRRQIYTWIVAFYLILAGLLLYSHQYMAPYFGHIFAWDPISLVAVGAEVLAFMASGILTGLSKRTPQSRAPVEVSAQLNP